MLAIIFWTLGILIACAGYEKLKSPVTVQTPTGKLTIVDDIEAPVVGLAMRNSNGTYGMIVEGYKYKGKIIINRLETLGHELVHWLAWKYPRIFWSPDEEIY